MTLDLAHPIDGNRYQHRKGGTYTVLGTAKVQTDVPLADYAEVVVYQSEDAERSIWVRPVAEFTDGRFAALASAPPPAVPDAVGVRERTMVDALDTIANGRVGESFTPAADVIALLMKVAQDALSSIEPTPSPEPQASNAGAELNPSVTMLREAITNIDAFGNEPSDRATVILERKDSSTFEMIGVGNEPLRLADLRKIAALTTPEPQTGERDGKMADVSIRSLLASSHAEADHWKRKHETAERRLAEAERAERARLFDLFERDPEQFTALCASNAALRAKPEAQAIVGKEAGE